MEIITDTYEIYADSSQVTMYSTARLPLEPNVKSHREFKANARHALTHLVAPGVQGLHGIYGSAVDNDFFDTENALYYNVGTSAGKQSAHHFISFETLTAQQTRKQLQEKGKSEFKHYYCYSVRPGQSTAKEPVLEWRGIPLFSIRGDRKPFEYWRALREHPRHVSLYSHEAVQGGFALDIHIESPEDRYLNLANPMKAMLDGIICAFHRMPSSVEPEKRIEVANRLDYPMERFAETPFAVLGEAEYVKPYCNGVFWNPQDHRCKQAHISIAYGKPQWAFDGRMFAL